MPASFRFPWTGKRHSFGWVGGGPSPAVGALSAVELLVDEARVFQSARTGTLTAADTADAAQLSGTALSGAPQDPANITAFTLTSAVSDAAVPFTIGMPFVENDIADFAAPTASVAIVGATAQVTPKNYWPNGSLKFAVISGTANLTAGAPVTITVRRAGASSGTALTTADLKNAMAGQTCSIGGGTFGTVSWATTDWDAPFETWISGHRMSSWAYRKPLPNDSHLVGWLEVRLYAGGIVEVLPWIENGMLLVSGPTSKAETYTFTLGSTQRFSQALDICHHTRTVLINGTHTSYWLGTTHDVVVKHEGDYLQATKQVPSYFVKSDLSAPVGYVPTSYAPFQLSNWPAGMGSPGFHPSIGILPQWDVLYLTCDNPITYKGVVFNGYSSGGFDFHYRDESDGHRPARLSQHTTLSIRPPAEGWVTTPATSGTAPYHMNSTHQPLAGYVAYLVTGRRYFLDEVQFLASFDSLAVNSTVRQGALGLYDSFYGSERYVAWCQRTLVCALSATPDSDTAWKNEYRTQWSNNVTFYHDTYIGASNDPYNPRINNGGFVGSDLSVAGYAVMNGYVKAGTTPTTTTFRLEDGSRVDEATADGHLVGWKVSSYSNGEERTVTSHIRSTQTITVSPAFSTPPVVGSTIGLNIGPWWQTCWMNDFITGVWGFAKDLKPNLGTTQDARADRNFTWKAQSVIKRFGGAGASEYLYREHAVNYIPVSPSYTPDWVGGTGPWYVNQGNGWGDLYTHAYSGTAARTGSFPAYDPLGPKVEGSIRGHGADPGWSSEIAPVPPLAYAVRHGVAGADRAYRRFSTDPIYAPFANNFKTTPIFSVSPYPRPKWARGQQVGEWRQIPNSKLYDCVNTTTVWTTTHSSSGVIGRAGRLIAYGGLTIDTRSSKLWVVAGGGHNDWFGNEIIYLDLLADAPTWTLHFAGSNGDVAHAGSNASQPPRYTDGMPSSRHTYYGTQFIERHNRAMTFGGSYSASGATGSYTEAFDISSAPSPSAWDPISTYAGLFGGPGSAISLSSYPCMTKDPRTEEIYVWGASLAQNVAKHVPSANGPSGAQLSGSTYVPLMWTGQNTGSKQEIAVDTTRNRILWRGLTNIASNSAFAPHLYDITTNTVTQQDFSGTSAAVGNPTLSSYQYYTLDASATGLCNQMIAQGMVYVPNIDAYMFRSWEPGGRIWQINAGTLEVTFNNNFGGDAIPKCQTTGEIGGFDGAVYNKFQYVPELRGVVYVPGDGENAWFLRVW